MSVLSWGKPLIEYAIAGDNPTFAEILGTIVEGTAQLVTNKGAKKEAIGAGGELVDVRYNKNTYTLTVEYFIKKGYTQSIADSDGVVAGEYAVRIIPEDDTLQGYQMPKTKVTVEKTFSDENGARIKYTFDGLKPATGDILQDYTKPAPPSGV